MTDYHGETLAPTAKTQNADPVAQRSKGEKSMKSICTNQLVLLLVGLLFVVACGDDPGKPAAEIAFASNRDGNTEIYLMNANGTNQVRLTDSPGNDTSPAGAPDGSKIAFVSDRDAAASGGQDVFVMDPDGANQENITSPSSALKSAALLAGAEVNGEPAWSPDSEMIAFSSNRDGNYEIYRMGADGSSPDNLTSSPGGDHSPAWSPEGDKIVFYSYRDGDAEIYSMNADGTDEQRLTNDCGSDRAPQWSSDGTQIVFDSNRGGNFEVYIMNSDGSDPVPLSDLPGYNGGPTWAPKGSSSGQKIAFTSEEAGKFEVFVMNSDGSGKKNITNGISDDGAPSWLP